MWKADRIARNWFIRKLAEMLEMLLFSTLI